MSSNLRIEQITKALVLRAKFQGNIICGVIDRIESEEQKDREYWEKFIEKIKTFEDLKNYLGKTLLIFSDRPISL